MTDEELAREALAPWISDYPMSAAELVGAVTEACRKARAEAITPFSERMLEVLEMDAVKRAEESIRAILVGLEERTGKSIERVEVDTRHFAQLATEITLTTEQRR